MATTFRMLGWFFFILGAGICVYQITYSTINWKDPITMLGAIGMPLGMLCNGVAVVLGIVERQRAQRARLLQNLMEPAPPALDPDKPEKHYEARPLKTKLDDTTPKS
jgi:hypothetical protein